VSIGPFGRLAIGPTGSPVYFTADPRSYRPWQWKKRASFHPGIQGSMTIQDFGVVSKDLVIEIESPEDAFLEASVVKQLHEMYRTKGAVYRLTDWVGNDFTVWLEDFQPEANENLPGYRYSMRLKVQSITTLFGAPYTGP